MASALSSPSQPPRTPAVAAVSFTQPASQLFAYFRDAERARRQHGHIIKQYRVLDVLQVSDFLTLQTHRIRSIVYLVEPVQRFQDVASRLVIKAVPLSHGSNGEEAVFTQNELRLHYVLTMLCCDAWRQYQPHGLITDITQTITSTRYSNVVRLFDYVNDQDNPDQSALHNIDSVADAALRKRVSERLSEYTSQAPNHGVGLYMFIVMEYGGVSLESFLKQDYKQRLNDTLLLPLLLQQLSTLHSLMAIRFTHHDLHTNNVLLQPVVDALPNLRFRYVWARDLVFDLPMRNDSSYVLKLMDFGFSTARFYDTAGKRFEIVPAIDRFERLKRANFLYDRDAGMTFAPAHDLALFAVALLKHVLYATRNEGVPLDALSGTLRALRVMLPRDATHGKVETLIARANTFFANPHDDTAAVALMDELNKPNTPFLVACAFDQHSVVPYDVIMCGAFDHFRVDVDPRANDNDDADKKSLVDMTLRPGIGGIHRYKPEDFVVSHADSARLQPLIIATGVATQLEKKTAR